MTTTSDTHFYARGKVLSLDELVLKREELRGQGKTVVQSHGVFDLIHPGIIQHLAQAKTQGDVLVVTVIRDQDVRRGPGRPVFPGELRVQNVAALAPVDYVCLVDDAEPFACVGRLKPDVFAKGQAFKERDRHLHERIFAEERDLFFESARIHETQGLSFSSTDFLRDFLNIYPEETADYLRDFAGRHPLESLIAGVERAKKLRVLLIGDAIIDEYHYCDSLGKVSKANLVAARYLKHEVFAGGAFAIANHLAGICDEVGLITLLGETDSRYDFARQHLLPNVSAQFVYREDGPTVIKKRYVHEYLNQKLFEVNYLANAPLPAACEKRLLELIDREIGKYDLVCVSDFGHDLITKPVMELIEAKAKRLAVNTQTNSANSGFNLITKYRSPHFICLDEREARLAAQERYAPVEDVAAQLVRQLKPEFLIVTLGKKGALGLDREGRLIRTPIFSTKVVDTVGAGDAFFSFTAPCQAAGLPGEVVCLVGNAVGALAVQVMCNRRPVEPHEVFAFIRTLYQGARDEKDPS